MSGECEKCGEHALDCLCAQNAGEMSIIIMESIENSPPELVKYCPDALIRVLVYTAKKNGWTLNKILKEVDFSIKYYYKNI